MKKILLVGYMGAGKTEIGKILAKKLNLPFYDLDNLIEENQKSNISEIFKTKGEIYFRRIEHEIYLEKLNTEESFILSLGGGTPCYANNHLEFKRENVISIYLKANIETIVERVFNEKGKRPLIANKTYEELLEFVAKHLFERNYYYNQSKIKISVDEKTPTDIVNEIDNILF